MEYQISRQCPTTELASTIAHLYEINAVQANRLAYRYLKTNDIILWRYMNELECQIAYQIVQQYHVCGLHQSEMKVSNNLRPRNTIMPIDWNVIMTSMLLFGF